jgi:hypothetical protein
MKVYKFPGGEYWYDRSILSWTVRKVDAEGNQIGEAQFAGTTTTRDAYVRSMRTKDKPVEATYSGKKPFKEPPMDSKEWIDSRAKQIRAILSTANREPYTETEMHLWGREDAPTGVYIVQERDCCRVALKLAGTTYFTETILQGPRMGRVQAKKLAAIVAQRNNSNLYNVKKGGKIVRVPHTL